MAAIARYNPNLTPSSVNWKILRAEKLLSVVCATLSAVTRGKMIRWSPFGLTFAVRVERSASRSATPAGKVEVSSEMLYSPGPGTGIRKFPSPSVVAPPTSSMDTSTPATNTLLPAASVYCN